MLALSRKVGEAIIINDDITIEIISAQDGKAKVGISAPKEVRILRKEVYHDIQENNKLSVKEKGQLGALKGLLKGQ